MELRLGCLDGFCGLRNAHESIPYVGPWLASTLRHEAEDSAKES
jgi:hypothetical protein